MLSNSPTTISDPNASSPPPAPFQPIDRTESMPDLNVPGESWLTILETQCAFGPEIFDEIMLNLIRNPNITSSHLFRADIYFDSNAHPQDGGEKLLRQMKPDLRPWSWEAAAQTSWECVRTMVRELIPRNPQLDRGLVQTCRVFKKQNKTSDRDQSDTHEEGGHAETLILYIPHIDNMADMPFYHPPVPRLAFHHTYNTNTTSNPIPPSRFSISYSQPPIPLPPKLHRTALRLLQTLHKHGQGQLTGYQKRVHHDQLVPQKRYQDTYTRLKTRYGKRLSEQWVEATDPGKHVFEDLGIAAFLMELWGDMYGGKEGEFSGFVDVGCGNGLLTFILLSEGYEGWGFDARERKTWGIFPEKVRARLERRVLVPEVFLSGEGEEEEEGLFHSGVFARGTFVISNHADELTTWTPLLAYLNGSAPFVAIPCCSHDFSGARFRAPVKGVKGTGEAAEEQSLHWKSSGGNGAETGSLQKSKPNGGANKSGKPPSAYSSLCSYVAALTEQVGFEVESEVLRIPSTRNQAILGRRVASEEGVGKRAELTDEEDREARKREVIELVEREMKRSIEAVAGEWKARVSALVKKPGSGH